MTEPTPAPRPSARLSYALVTAAETERLAAILRDPDVRRFLCDGRVLADDEVARAARASEALAADAGMGLYFARLSDSGEVAGIAGVRAADPGGVELVCAILPAHQRRGLAEEACRACLAAAAQAGLTRILAGADAPNTASLRLIARLGFRPVGETTGVFGPIRWFTLELRPTPPAPPAAA